MFKVMCILMFIQVGFSVSGRVYIIFGHNQQYVEDAVVRALVLKLWTFKHLLKQSWRVLKLNQVISVSGQRVM